MPAWQVSGAGGSGTVELRSRNGGYLVEGPDGAVGTDRKEEALNVVRHRLKGALSGARGLSGWSLTVSVGTVTAFYGDARPPGGAGGARSEEGACVGEVRGREKMQPPQAIEKSILVVRRCWDG